MPKISVIVPSYNVENFLAETLDSVRSQTYGDWECIIVDDGSTDGTWKVAKEFCNKDPRFRLIHQENKGLAGARNAGIDNASGEFILPLDADDLIGREYMEMAMRVFMEQPDVKLVYCKARMFGVKDRNWELPQYNYRRLIAINHIFCTCFFRRADAIDAGKYDVSFRTGYEDWDFLLRLLGPNDKVVRIDKVLFFYRQHSTETLVKTAMKNESQILKRIVEKYPNIYAQYMDRLIYQMRFDIEREEQNAQQQKKKKMKGLLSRLFNRK